MPKNNQWQVGNISFDTTLTTDGMTKRDDIVPIAQTKEDNDIVGYILGRYESMRSARSFTDQEWRTIVTGFESMYKPYPDGRSSSIVPLERALVEMYVSEAIKRPTQFNVREDVGNEYQSKILDRLWKQDWLENKRNNTILKNEYDTAIFGTSWLYTGFEQTYRIVNDFVGIGDKGKPQYQRKMIMNSEIVLQNVDIRNVYVDERAHSIEEANDAMIIEFLTIDEVKNLRNDSNYKNIDALAATYLYQGNNYVFMSQEEIGKGNAYYVKITKYWNKRFDEYIEVGNDAVVIRRHPILNATHDIPLVCRNYGRKIASVYGLGLCEACRTFKSEINVLRELLMDSIKRSNQEVIFLGGGLTFDGEEFGYNNQIRTYTGGDLASNFKQVTGSPPNQFAFNFHEQLFHDIAAYIGYDVQNVSIDPNITAFQASLQKESSLSRVNVAFYNRDMSFERMAELHKNNLQIFYPLKEISGVQELDANGKPIKVQWKEPTLTLEGEDVKDGKIIRKTGKRTIQITPEDIRADLKMEVYTDFNAPTLNEVRKEQTMQFLTQLP